MHQLSNHGIRSLDPAAGKMTPDDVSGKLIHLVHSSWSNTLTYFYKSTATEYNQHSNMIETQKIPWTPEAGPPMPGHWLHMVS